jgi:subtilisin family serine protease
MKPLRELRRWLGRTGRDRPLAGKALRCERLEDRLTPASGLTTGTELLAVTTSGQPIRDLQNVVAAFDLAGAIDFSRTELVLSTADASLLQIGLSSSANALAVQQTLLATGLYASVAPNFVYSSGTPGLTDVRERTPNDPRAGEQYHHPIIRTPTAWDTTIGTAGVIVAVLDDGVYVAHPDLRNTVWANAKEVAGDGIDNDANGFTDDTAGWNFVGNNNNVNPTDPIADNHGTQVAGLIAAQFDNNEGVAGVAGGARVMPVKVVGTGGSTTSLALARAISYAVQNGARIVNTSINVDPFVDDPTFAAAVGMAYDRGILLVNSAGNTGTNNPPRVTLEELVVVAASDRNDAKTAYSNFGSGIDITAPGGTADDGLLTTIPLTGYAGAFGTSMAAPLVAGVAALVWSANPTWTRDMVAAAVIATTDDILAKNPDYEDQLGSGRLNAAKAVGTAKVVTKLGKLTGLPEEGADAPESITSFNLRLHSPLDPTTVTKANFELRWAGPDGAFGSADDALLPFDINGGREYKIGTNDLVFTVNRTLDRGLYRFTAKAGGLRDPFGSPIDGDGNGSAGGNLVRNFGIAYQVGGTVYNDVDDDGFQDSNDPGVPGATVFADLNGNGRLDRFTFTGQGGAALPDGGTAAVPVPVGGFSQVQAGLSVRVEIFHPRPSELTMVLVAPDGTRLTLFDRRFLPSSGTSTHLFTFEDGIEEESESISTIMTHRLRPTEPFGDLAGRSAGGEWRVEVTDAAGGSVGGFHNVSLTFAAEPTATTNANGFFALNGLPTGGLAFLHVGPVGGFARAANGGAVPVDPSGPAPAAGIGLTRTAGVVGRVLQGDGTGLADAVVFIDFNRDGVANDEFMTRTDAFGNYEFPGLPNGLYPVTAAPPPGYLPAAGRSVALTPDAPVARGTDFVVSRDARPVTVTIAPVTPALRNSPVNAIAFALSEPLPGLTLANVGLSFNGQPVSLAGATLIGGGTSYTVIGLGDVTGANGTFAFTVAAPAPPGQPERQPASVFVSWTADVSPPNVRLEGIFANDALVGVTVLADEPVVGLNASDFRAFDRNNVAIPIGGATFDVAPDGRSAVLRLPAEALGRGYVRVQLDGPAAGITDLAGNPFLGNFGVAHSKGGQQPGPQVTARRTVFGTDAGGSPAVMVYDSTTGALVRILPVFEPGFTGGVRVAAGDVTGDGVEDIVVGAGRGGGPRVRIFDGVTFQPVADFMAFEPTFTGGVFVTVGDFNNDGRADVVVSADKGGGPRVKVVDGTTQNVIADFFGIADAAFRGGARTAVGDLNGDGFADLFVAAGAGGGPRVAGYDGLTLGPAPRRLFNDFFAFDPNLRDGVFLAAGAMNADGFADLVIGAGAGGGPRVRVLSGQQLLANVQAPLADFFAGDPRGRAGVRVAVKHGDPGSPFADLVTADGLGVGRRVRQFSAGSFQQAPPRPTSEFDVLFDSVNGGVFVG